MDTELQALRIRALKQRVARQELDALLNATEEALELGVELTTLKESTWAEIDKLWPIKRIV